MARGTLLGWLNADDLLLPDSILRVVTAFREHPDINWVYGDLLVSKGRRQRVAYPANLDDPRTWLVGKPATQPGSFITRSAFEQVGPLDETLHYAMDVDLEIRLVDAGIKGLYIPCVLAIFEIHEASKSGSGYHRFLHEEAWARARSERRSTASFAFGRALARAVAEGDRPESNMAPPDMNLPREASGIGRFETKLAQHLDADLVRSGMTLEKAVCEIRAGHPRGLLDLLARAVWSQELTRKVIWQGIRRKVAEEVRRRFSRDRAMMTDW